VSFLASFQLRQLCVDAQAPWRAALERLDVWVPIEGLAEVLPNDELFVEEQPHGRLLRLTLDGDVIWEYVNRAKMGRVCWAGAGFSTPRPAPGSPRRWPELIAAAHEYHRPSMIKCFRAHADHDESGGSVTAEMAKSPRAVLLMRRLGLVSGSASASDARSRLE
jgi:hypothetical protein